MNILINWCGESGFRDVLRFIKEALGIIRIVVPIGLIFLTAVDIFKSVINPEAKDGQTKILHRLLAAILVFLTPILVRLVLKLVSIGGGDNSVSSCWESIS